MSSGDPIEFSIIMPCLNEAETLAICIRKALGFLQRAGINGEVVIGDNGSTDGSIEIAIKEGARVVNVPVKGYGAALAGAIEGARGTFIIMGDSDDSYDFENLDLYVEKLRAGNDIVMGNRFKGGIKEGAMPFLHRYLGNPVLSFIGKVFFNIKVNDFHCGLRGFRKTSIQKLQLLTPGMEFASEMVVKAALFDLKMVEVPTTLSPDGRSRPPHLRTWRDGWRHLRFLLLYSPRWLFLYPGLALFVFSSIFFLLTLMGPQHIGSVILDVHSMAYFAAMIIASFQIIMFYIMSKVYAINQGLVPVNRNFNRIFDYLTLERGLLAGGVLVACGLGLNIKLIIEWEGLHFGNINDISQTIRLLLSSILLLIMGIQTVFSSLMLSILGIIKKEEYIAS